MRTRSKRVLCSSCRRIAVAATGMVAAGAAMLAGAGTAGAATLVDCSTANLQTAIDNAAPGATLIVTGTCSGNFTIDQNLNLIGVGTAVLDGQNAGTTLSISSGTVDVANLKITDGLGTGFTGGGIINGDPYTGTTGGTLTLRNSVVTGNSGGTGGGILNDGSLTLQATTVSDNMTGLFGGGINNSGTVTLYASTVSDNSAPASGGGIYSDSGTVTLDASAVRDNTVQGLLNLGGEGGGIILVGGSATLNASTVTGNTAPTSGGGIYNEGANATLNGSKVSGNTAGQNGGGIFFDTQSGGSMTLRATAVTSNVPDNCFPAGSVAGCVG